MKNLLPAALLMAFCLEAGSGRFEVTSATGTKFYSLPDDKGVVSAAIDKMAQDPKNPAVLLKLAQAHASIWQEREAVAVCTAAIKFAPDNAAAYLERGHRELPLRQFRDALDDLNHSVKLDP